MGEFLTLLGQIFIISCLQSIVELFIDPTLKSYQIRLINIACFSGSLYLIIQYISGTLISEISTVFKFAF